MERENLEKELKNLEKEIELLGFYLGKNNKQKEVADYIHHFLKNNYRKRYLDILMDENPDNIIIRTKYNIFLDDIKSKVEEMQKNYKANQEEDKPTPTYQNMNIIDQLSLDFLDKVDKELNKATSRLSLTGIDGNIHQIKTSIREMNEFLISLKDIEKKEMKVTNEERLTFLESEIKIYNKELKPLIDKILIHYEDLLELLDYLDKLHVFINRDFGSEISFNLEFHRYGDKDYKARLNHSLEEIKKLLGMSISDELIKDFNICRSGVIGERRVNEELDMYDDHIHNLSGIRINTPEGITIETDNILVSEFGVFSVEVKNYSEKGKYNIRISKDGKWEKIIGDKREPMQSVMYQSNRHIAYKQKLINKKIQENNPDADYVYISPIIVIANDNIDIINEGDLPVIRIANLYDYMRNNAKYPIQKQYIKEIINIFKEADIGQNTFPVVKYTETYKTIYEQIFKKLIEIKNVVDWEIKKTEGCCYHQGIQLDTLAYSNVEKMIKAEIEKILKLKNCDESYGIALDMMTEDLDLITSSFGLIGEERGKYLKNQLARRLKSTKNNIEDILKK